MKLLGIKAIFHGDEIVTFWEDGFIIKVLTEPKNPENASSVYSRQHEYIFLKKEIAQQWLDLSDNGE